MATDALSHEPHQTLPLEFRPNVDHLVTEDDTPVDNVFSEKQQRLLTEPLYSSWAKSNQQRPFVAMANVGLFYHLQRPAIVPDMLLSLDVDLPADMRPKQHRSYFVWEYGKPPEIVIEVVSNRDGGEDTHKLATYAKIGIRYYVIYDPYHFLGSEALRFYRLEGMDFRKLDEPAWLGEVGLGLGVWPGRYENMDDHWLRWFDASGALVPTGAERSDSAELRAETAESRAEAERQRAERLAEQLRQLGIEPGRI